MDAYDPVEAARITHAEIREKHRALISPPPKRDYTRAAFWLSAIVFGFWFAGFVATAIYDLINWLLSL